ncbi:hypothetical protein [Viridibacillus arvi]|uniref:hypothetical protein n=1 Tax=Viridibacillus arvi TaxID=263475 RepID=UPI0034CD4C77
MKNKIKFSNMVLVAGCSLIALFYPTIAFAESKKEAYAYMNTILGVSVTIAGFLVIFAIIKSGMKLATAQDNPQNRTAGLVGLGFAFLGGYMVFKALDIAGWLHGFFGL